MLRLKNCLKNYRVLMNKKNAPSPAGEEITKIYVDGKRVFLNDPKLATAGNLVVRGGRKRKAVV